MIKEEFIYLGHFKEDIYTILAKEEAMCQMVADTRRSLLMTCEVARPAITVAEREDINDLRVERCLADGIDFTRRLGGGSVIWLDERMLNYFFVASVGSLQPTDLEKFKRHQELGRKVALTVKGLGARNVYVGERFSVCLGRGPRYVIAGNSVILKKGYFVYHGVLVLDTLNIDAIKKYIVLRKNATLNEEEILSGLPSLYGAIGRKIAIKEVALRLAHKFTDGDFRAPTTQEAGSLEDASKPFVEKYKNSSWIFNPPSITKRNAGFCLIAFSESWDEKNFYAV